MITKIKTAGLVGKKNWACAAVFNRSTSLYLAYFALLYLVSVQILILFLYSYFFLFIYLLQNHFTILDDLLLSMVSSILVSNNKKLNPWYITGYSDGDSSFWFSIIPNKKLKVKYEVIIGFSIVAAINPANYKLMQLIDEFFEGIGIIVVDNKAKMYEYKVQGFKNCLKVKNHFLTYPLMTYRLVNFTMWCTVLDLIEQKLHLTIAGLNQLVNIKAAFPRGLTDNLK